MADPRTYVKLHDGFFRNRKARAVGKDGRELYLSGLCYAGGQLTDGIIPKNVIGLVAAEAEVKPAVARKLVEHGMWTDEGDHYRIHEFDEWQRSAAEVRRLSEVRAEAGRKGALAKAEALANAKANGAANGKHGAKQNGSNRPSKPVAEERRGEESPPHPVSEEPRAAPPDAAPPAPEEDDQDLDVEQRLTGLWPAWAKRREQRQIANTKPIPPAGHRRNAWLVSIGADLAKTHEPAARKLWEQHPNLTVDEVIARLEPPEPAATNGNGPPRTYRTDWGNNDDALEELPDGTVRQRGAP